MIKRAILLPLVLGLIGVAGFVAWGARPANPLAHPTAAHPVVLELFTAQGCSSCPPADAALAVFARDPNVVAISRPVTYWDSLGWRDTLARPANTELQRAYAARQHSDDVYTPQVVVQGTIALVGGRTGAIHRALDEALARPAPGMRFEDRCRATRACSGRRGTAAGRDSSARVARPRPGRDRAGRK
jgi:hypothetical protein